jgi:hypothetical protein
MSRNSSIFTVVFTLTSPDRIYDALGLMDSFQSDVGTPDMIFAIRTTRSGIICETHIADIRSLTDWRSQSKPRLVPASGVVLSQATLDSLVSEVKATPREEFPPSAYAQAAATSLAQWLDFDPALPAGGRNEPGNAWVLIYSVRWSGVYPEYNAYLDHYLYKLADVASYYDYYLHGVTFTTEITHPKPGNDAVQWIVTDRHLKLDGDQYDQSGYRQTTLLEHGPTTTVPEHSSGFSVGASVSSQSGFGLSAGYSERRSNPCVTTTDLSNNNNCTAEWNENFDGPDEIFWICVTTSCTPQKVT